MKPTPDTLEYRELPMPTKTQMHTVVKGEDRYRPRRSKLWWTCFAIVLAAALALLAYAATYFVLVKVE